jgi:hypothetical protein
MDALVSSYQHDGTRQLPLSDGILNEITDPVESSRVKVIGLRRRGFTDMERRSNGEDQTAHDHLNRDQQALGPSRPA